MTLRPYRLRTHAELVPERAHENLVRGVAEFQRDGSHEVMLRHAGDGRDIVERQLGEIKAFDEPQRLRHRVVAGQEPRLMLAGAQHLRAGPTTLVVPEDSRDRI